jgi:hypothetical protein
MGLSKSADQAGTSRRAGPVKFPNHGDPDVGTLLDRRRRDQARDLRSRENPTLCQARPMLESRTDDAGFYDHENPHGPDEYGGDLAPARGIAWSVALGVPVWVLLIALPIILF